MKKVSKSIVSLIPMLFCAFFAPIILLIVFYPSIGNSNNSTRMIEGNGAPKTGLALSGDVYIDRETFSCYQKQSKKWVYVENIDNYSDDKTFAYDMYKALNKGYKKTEKEWFTDFKNNVITLTKAFSVSFDSNGGSVVEREMVLQNETIPVPSSPIKNGYSFDKWYCNGYEWDFRSDSVFSDVSLLGGWNINTYNISYVGNGGIIPSSNRTTYTVETDFDLIPAYRDGYLFKGWYSSSGEKVDSFTTGISGDLTLYAAWVKDIKVLVSDETKCSVEVSGGPLIDDGTLVVKANPLNDRYHVFLGWHDDHDQLLSSDFSYSFKSAEYDGDYIKAVVMDDTQEEIWNIDHGVSLRIIDDTTATYGMYPQSVVFDETIISQLDQSEKIGFGDYYYFDHEYYVKKTAKLYDVENSCFDDETVIVNEKEYWFRVNAIEWSIKLSTNSQYQLVSNQLLDVGRYYHNANVRIIDDQTIYPNNYEYSDMRYWFNNDFFNIAFKFNSSNIKQTLVDNSLESVASDSEKYICSDTLDYVYTLSYKDYESSDESAARPERLVTTSEYARCCGARFNTNNGFFSGYYWTRSPKADPNDKDAIASRVNMNGTLNSDYVAEKIMCYRPVINVEV